MTSNSNTITDNRNATKFSTVTADGISIFYREAGAKDAPVMLLLHGFPSSSHQYRNLIPKLATRYRVIAPDLPGFGFTDVPAERNYKYTFDNLAKTMQAFLEKVGVKKFSVYIFDYGAPVGLRLAIANPENVDAIVSQNGNAYEEGLGEFWAPLKKYWADSSKENREALRPFMAFDATKWQYTVGVPQPDLVAPESYTLDAALIQRPGNVDIQLDLFLDYGNNLPLYPTFQAYFKKSQVPMLAIWGKNDPIFTPPGAEAFKRDNKNVTVELIDAGHFALETHCDYIGEKILATFKDQR
jgi:pimeloyl-ACP methyl ester carboxylesterase